MERRKGDPNCERIALAKSQFADLQINKTQTLHKKIKNKRLV
jgi:hypothetical protein